MSHGMLILVTDNCTTQSQLSTPLEKTALDTLFSILILQRKFQFFIWDYVVVCKCFEFRLPKNLDFQQP